MNWLWTSCLTSSKCCQKENHQKGYMKHESAGHLWINDELYETTPNKQFITKACKLFQKAFTTAM